MRVFVGLLGLAIAAPAAAQSTSPFTLPVSLRYVGGFADGAQVRAEDETIGDTLPDDDFGAARVRVRPTLRYSMSGFFLEWKAAIDAELQAQVHGGERPNGLGRDPVWDQRDDRYGERLSEAYAMVAGPWLAIRAGLMRSGFGLGTVANSGEDVAADQVRRSPFGSARHGDRNLRFQLGIFPLGLEIDPGGAPKPPLALALAADAVVEDDTSRWADGDRTYQLIAGLSGFIGDLSATIGGVWRSQDYDEGGITEVIITVVSARYDAVRRGRWRLWAEGEWAGYFGESDLSQSAIREGPFDVAATGGALRLGVSRRLSKPSWLDAVLEAGYASGDDNPFDGEIHTFTFDREYRLGLLMFGEALRQHAAITAHNVADETFRGEPPRGFDTLAHGGAVQNAIYVNPRLGWRAGGGFTLTLGYLYALSEEPYTDAFRSGVNGGATTGPRGALDERALGHEIDVGVEYAMALDPVALRIRVEGAWFAPGSVFDDEDGASADAMKGLWWHMAATW